MSDELAGAGITAKERLERIEALLDRMDRKLDSKVEIAEFVALETRVREIELHGSSQVQETMSQVTAIRARAEHQLNEMQEAIVGVKTRIAYAAGAVAVIVVIVNVWGSGFHV